MSTNPTMSAVPRARRLQINKFDPKDKAGKKALVAWLKGHPQITNVKNGGTWLEIEVETGGFPEHIKLTGKVPYLVWDPEEGLLHYSEEKFHKIYNLTK